MNSGNRFMTASNPARSVRSLFGANGWGTVVAEVVVAVPLVLMAQQSGWFPVPLPAGVSAGIVFRFAKWESLPCRLPASIPLINCLRGSRRSDCSDSYAVGESMKKPRTFWAGAFLI